MGRAEFGEDDMTITEIADAIDRGAVEARKQKLEELGKNEKFLELSEENKAKTIYLVCYGYGHRTTTDELIRKSRDVEFWPGISLEEVAMELIVDGALGEIDEKLWGYLDFKAMAKDMELSGYDETTIGVFYMTTGE